LSLFNPKFFGFSNSSRILGRKTTGAGKSEELTADDVKEILSLNNVTNDLQVRAKDVLLVQTILDMMEYATDAAAQTAYVSNGFSDESVLQQQTDGSDSSAFGDIAGTEYRRAQSFQIQSAAYITAVEVKAGGTKVGSPTGNWTLRIETDNGGVPSGNLANANASIAVTPPVANAIVKGTFATPVELSIDTTYWIVIQCDNQSPDNYWYLLVNSFGGYSYGQMATLSGGSWGINSGFDIYFKLYSKTQYLQCYSEPTIKNQGDYSLRCNASITTSLNKTLTRTISPTIDLTGKLIVSFDIYSSRTGSNLKIAMHDSGGITLEKTISVTSANVWETIVWDISAINDSNKNAIDAIVITITNADAANVFYIDNMFAYIKIII